MGELLGRAFLDGFGIEKEGVIVMVNGGIMRGGGNLVLGVVE